MDETLRRSLDQLRALAGHLQRIREEERTRLAREIHDELGQALASIKLDLAALVAGLSPSDEVTARRLVAIMVRADETIQSVRRIATELRPAILDDLGLVAAFEWAGEEFQTRTGIVCRVRVPKTEVTLPPERATALFRILQETLTNVARHAHATAVDVRLVREDAALVLEVRDNGVGFIEQQVPASQSLGILGMRERALLLGGVLTLDSAPGAGTRMMIQILRPEVSEGASGD